MRSDIQTTCVNPGKQLVVANPAALAGFSCKNLSGATFYLMLFDAAALPANGTAAKREWEIGPGQTYEWDQPALLPLTTGLVLAVSTTPATLTITGTNDALIDSTYFYS